MSISTLEKLSAVLHQDWICDHKTWQEAVEYLGSSMSQENLAQLRKAVADLLVKDDAAIRIALKEAGVSYYPLGNNAYPTYKAWVTELLSTIDHITPRSA